MQNKQKSGDEGRNEGGYADELELDRKGVCERATVLLRARDRPADRTRTRLQASGSA